MLTWYWIRQARKCSHLHLCTSSISEKPVVAVTAPAKVNWNVRCLWGEEELVMCPFIFLIFELLTMSVMTYSILN